MTQGVLNCTTWPRQKRREEAENFRFHIQPSQQSIAPKCKGSEQLPPIPPMESVKDRSGNSVGAFLLPPTARLFPGPSKDTKIHEYSSTSHTIA